jgi:hypothetical protein
MTPIVDVATDRIQRIISYAAAETQAQERIKFYHMISMHPMSKKFVGQMFKRFVSLSFRRGSSSLLPCFTRLACPQNSSVREGADDYFWQPDRFEEDGSGRTRTPTVFVANILNVDRRRCHHLYKRVH